MPADGPGRHLEGALRPAARRPAGLSADEKQAYEQLDFFYKNGLGYAQEMSIARRRSTALDDSPIGLAAWMLDHDDRSYELIARVFDGQTGGPDARRHPRQRHALLADRTPASRRRGSIGKASSPSSHRRASPFRWR